ncbi:hypothetical protein [Mucilaginibacter sp. dw_454]|uniref:hypothetical protein n=1 Tax=Mucilaginibacter sp. dw_454 TaxID=2720079 RepID=UPI001BD4F0C0|nr:hypothetical protein [Mucilaginibacter sp. dw_454]
MFRKIHSNRDPKATLYSELKREFSPYFESAGAKTQLALQKNPKPFFWGMLALLLLSAVLSFTIFRKPATPQRKVGVVKPVSRKKVLDDGFERILATGAALKRTLQIKSEVTGLLAKGKLNHADSLALEGALDSLGQIQHQINH